VPDHAAARDDAEHEGALPHRRVTVNMLVSYNLARFRRAAGLTQKEFGAALGGWSEASVSIAERGWDGRRIRKFDADELARIAMVFGIPVIALLLPPEDAGTAVDYFFDVGGNRLVILEGMLREVLPAYEGGTPAADAFIERVIKLGGDRYIREAEEVLSRAREGAVEILDRSPQQSEQITSNARVRAESLERDARERHRLAMGSLIQSREELERRVNDLRAFEREYRTRLLAYVDGQRADLMAGAANDDVFPPVGDAEGQAEERP
jgi:transcriptional regulator with XRE-family HTH domain